MKGLMMATAVAAACLAGCNKPKDVAASVDEAKGRFAGVGIFAPGRMWSQIANADAPKSPAAARLKDDEQVIVVVDTKTGEVRQCGNLSGYCVGMNPWARPLSGPQTVPLSVLKHAEDLERESDAANARLSHSAAAHAKPAEPAPQP